MQAVEALKASQKASSSRPFAQSPTQPSPAGEGSQQQEASSGTLPLTVILDAVDNLVDER